MGVISPWHLIKDGLQAHRPNTPTHDTGKRRVLTMHMRHLYRSPLRICFSSSRMRAFSASSVVAVESSVILRGNERELLNGNNTNQKQLINASRLVNVYLTLSAAYELAITKSIRPPLIVRRGACRDVYGDPLIFQPDGALIYSIDLTLRQRSPRQNPPD